MVRAVGGGRTTVPRTRRRKRRSGSQRGRLRGRQKSLPRQSGQSGRHVPYCTWPYLRESGRGGGGLFSTCRLASLSCSGSRELCSLASI